MHVSGGRSRRRGRGRGKESQADFAVSVEPDLGLAVMTREITTHKIMIRAKTKSRMLSRLS